MDWKPISEAPKDGTPIRVFGPDPSNEFTGKYDGPAYWTGLYWRKLHRHGFVNMVARPTHFMPLPAPPTPTQP